MLRWLLVGSLVAGIGVGLQNGWVEVHWDRLVRDVGLPFLSEPEPLKEFNRSR